MDLIWPRYESLDTKLRAETLVFDTYFMPDFYDGNFRQRLSNRRTL